MLTLRNRLTERWAKQEEQVVHLGASTIPSAYILPELLPAYRRRQPEIRFDIHQSDSQGVIDGCSEAVLKWDWWDSRDRSHPWNISPFTGIPWCSSRR